MCRRPACAWACAAAAAPASSTPSPSTPSATATPSSRTTACASWSTPRHCRTSAARSSTTSSPCRAPASRSTTRTSSRPAAAALPSAWRRKRKSPRSRGLTVPGPCALHGPMRLYDYAASGNCFKVRLLLALLGRGYERVPVDIFAGETLTDAYGALNPLRETPVLELDDGRTLTQSNAILWFLAEGTDFLPADAFPRGEVAMWLSFEQERVMGGIGGPRFRVLTGRPFDPARLETGRGALEYLDAHLAERAWL